MSWWRGDDAVADLAMPRSRRVRLTLRVTADVVVAVATIWLAGLIWFAETFPEPGAAQTGQTDAIVVVTGGSGRLEVGLSLLANKRARKLFVSGVYRGVDVKTLLRLARNQPQELACCIVLGYTADNTAGNARETAAWMRAEGFRSLRLVTASYHIRRSMLEFRRHMPEVAITLHPVFPKKFKQSQWWRWPGSASLIANEFNKYLLASVRVTLFGPASSAKK